MNDNGGEQIIDGHAVHPVARIFPPMAEDAFRGLVEDVRANDLREAGWLFQGQIIDGVHRARACAESGRAMRWNEWTGDAGELVKFVLSLNLHRRHLNESQRAMVAARIATLGDGNPHFKAKNATSPIGEVAVAAPEAAKAMSVSIQSVTRARKVRDRGIPELATAVDRGDVSVAAASRVAEHEPDVQREIVANGPAAVVAESSRMNRAPADGKPHALNGPAAKVSARVVRVGELIRELEELAARPYHRMPYVQIKEKVRELAGAFAKAFPRAA